MAPARAIRGFLQNELGRLIGNHLRDKATGCEVLANSGVVPRLLSADNVRIPDLAVTCSPLAVGQATLPGPILLIAARFAGPDRCSREGVWCLPPAILADERRARSRSGMAPVRRNGPAAARLRPCTDDQRRPSDQLRRAYQRAAARCPGSTALVLRKREEREYLVSRRNASPGRGRSSSFESRCFLKLPRPR